MPVLKVANIHFDTAGTTHLRANGANTVTLETAGSERIRVDATGNVLIGRAASTVGLGVKLDIAGAVNVSALYVNGASVLDTSNSYTQTVGAAANGWSNTISATRSTASNTYADTVGTAGNNYTITVGAAANGWANTISATRSTASNTYADTVGAAANGWANTISATRSAAANGWANTYAASVGTAGNAYAVSVGTAGNAYAQTVGTAGNNYTITVGAAANGWANTYAASVGTAGNNYTITVGAAANGWANTISDNRSAAANGWANTKLSNTSGVSFNGNLTVPGEFTVGGNLIFDTTQSTRIWEPAANTLAFFTTQSERMRIDSSGNVGIGELSPLAALHIARSSDVDFLRLQRTGGSNIPILTIGLNETNKLINFTATGAAASSIAFTLGGSERMRIENTGNVLIGRTDSTVGLGVKLDVAGAINASAIYVNGGAVTGGGGTVNVAIDTVNATRYVVFEDATSGTLALANVSTSLTYNPSTGTLSSTIFNSTSDENKKTNVQTISSALEVVKQLRGVGFNWADNGLPSYGLIAQEVEQVIPEVVGTNPDGSKTLNYNALIGFLVEAVKELASK